MSQNQIKNRILFLSPTVTAGLESECKYLDNFESQKMLGEGGFGKVYLCKNKKNGKQYAIKLIKKSIIIEQNMQAQINREVLIMYKLQHNNIISIYNHFEDDDHIYLIQEYLKGQELYKMMLNAPGKKLKPEQVAQIIHQLCFALKEIHSNNIIHRDIKAENIYICDDGTLKILDFGWSNYIEEKNKKRMTYAGTVLYQAPEMIESKIHDHTIDIWSVGVLMFELLTGRDPFSPDVYKGSEEDIKNEIKMRVIKGKYESKQHDPLATQLIKNILKYEPRKRFTLDRIMKDTWMSDNVNKRFIEKYMKKLELDESFNSNRDKYMSQHENKINQNLSKKYHGENFGINELRGSIRPDCIMDDSDMFDVGNDDISVNSIPKTKNKPEGLTFMSNENSSHNNDSTTIEKFTVRSVSGRNVIAKDDKSSLAVDTEKELNEQHQRRKNADYDNYQLKSQIAELEKQLETQENLVNNLKQEKSEMKVEFLELKNHFSEVETNQVKFTVNNRSLKNEYNFYNSNGAISMDQMITELQSQVQRLSNELEQKDKYEKDVVQIRGKNKILDTFNKTNESKWKMMIENCVDKNTRLSIKNSSEKLKEFIKEIDNLSTQKPNEASLLKSYKEVLTLSELLNATR